MQTLDDNSGQALQILCDSQVNLNISEVKESGTTLMRFLRKANCCRHFKATQTVMDILEYMLAHGADPNKPPHTLAYAVNYCPLDVCKLLVSKGANVNSEFRTDDRMLALANRSLSKIYEIKVRESRETALHTAYRIGSLGKIKLLISQEANEELEWIGLKTEQTFVFDAQTLMFVLSVLFKGI